MNDNAKHFIAGGISGMATVISGYPLGNELKFRYLIQSMIDELIRP